MPFDTAGFIDTDIDDNVTRILEAARKLIGDKKRWCRNCLMYQRRTGMAYCAVGALEFVAGPALTEEERARKLLDALATRTHRGLTHFNDDRARIKHQDILNLFDEAIELSRLRIVRREKGNVVL